MPCSSPNIAGQAWVSDVLSGMCKATTGRQKYSEAESSFGMTIILYSHANSPHSGRVLEGKLSNLSQSQGMQGYVPISQCRQFYFTTYDDSDT